MPLRIADHLGAIEARTQRRRVRVLAAQPATDAAVDDGRDRVDLERIGLASLVEIVGTFVAGPKVLEAATAMSLPVTDDRPLTEYARRSLRRKPGFPAEVFDPRELNAWCPACYPGGTPHPKLAQLGTYLGILGRLYRSPTFLGKPGPTFVVSDRPKYRSVIEGSLYMRRIFGVPTSTIASPPTSD